VNSGKSQNQNSDNSNNTSSTSTQSDNPFASGGTGGKEGAGKGKFGGVGNSGDSDGPSTGGGNGKRSLLNKIDLPPYPTAPAGSVYLQLSINGNGDVVHVNFIRSKSQRYDVNIIDDIISRVIQKVKYTKDPNMSSSLVYITLNVN
jgi:hypothetical protein